MYREKLYEYLNVLDGNIGYLCMADDVLSVLGLFWGSFRALFGAFVCAVRFIWAEKRKGGF